MMLIPVTLSMKVMVIMNRNRIHIVYLNNNKYHSQGLNYGLHKKCYHDICASVKRYNYS